ncbi:hypothetical protein [Dictyobacter kobayashii]|uniref:Uncharacterized protein n=1 Tax=Dictyobacter kobayashii TaxID=2014872 RepID=A0A402AEW9_9CHLR|nr:hypothetical protein [Dictyobacter kobayashii]GCE17660.1 hypothetical protein KDK_14600 [Dictyobacter kobayashii]
MTAYVALPQIKKQDFNFDELAPVERNIARVIAEQDNLTLAISKVDLSQSGAIYAINSLTGLLGQKAEERQKLEAEKYKIIDQQKHLQSIAQKLDEFKNKCLEISKNLSEEPDYKTKREVIEFLGLRVTVWPHKSDPRYKFELAPPSIVSNKPWPGESS